MSQKCFNFYFSRAFFNLVVHLLYAKCTHWPITLTIFSNLAKNINIMYVYCQMHIYNTIETFHLTQSIIKVGKYQHIENIVITLMKKN
jgi:hypothetical protein